ncbi:MAG: NeuD/PglB/VioB family sugar acetyltransferase [Candidatus Eisenbacteria sp.]|nr:NeuD/PglB/VioB family sugar acetyltransferase [Candidatus Eisenbacteria bacterium]
MRSQVESQVVIIGASGHGRVALDLLQAAGCGMAGFIDRGMDPGSEINGAHVLAREPEECELLGKPEVGWFVALGDNATRRSICQRIIKLTGRPPVNLIHPSAIVSPSVTLGHGVFIGPGAAVNANSSLADGVIVNTGATLDHDAQVGAYAQISPGCHLAGNAVLGALSFLGVGCCLIPGRSVGAGAMVGAGAVVVRDIPERVVAMGSPARVTRQISNSDPTSAPR